MARPTSNVIISTDSFATWVGVTNFMADTFTRYTLTANNSTVGANVSGNSQLWGIFAANVVSAGDSIRGGTVNATANLNVVSNAIFTGATVNATSNVNIRNTNTSVNSAVLYIVGGLANVTSNVSALNSNTYINTASMVVVGGLASISSNVVATGTNVNTSSNVNITGTVHTVGGNVNFDTGTLFVDSVNNRIGIINTTPDASLTVTGTANVSSNVAFGSFLTVGNATSIANNLVVVGTANISANATVGSFLTVGNAASVANNLTVTGTANVSTLINVGANVNISVSQINIGNSSANHVINSTSMSVGSATTNTVITGSQISTNGTLYATGNTTLANTLSVAGAATLSNTANIAGATTLSSTLSVGGNTTLQTDVVLAIVSNTNIGTTTASAVEIFNFPVATYTGAKITAKIGTLGGANTQVQELIIAQNSTDVVLTVYGTVAAPATANLGVFTASINSTAVSVKFQQTGANSSVKLFTQLIK